MKVLAMNIGKRVTKTIILTITRYTVWLAVYNGKVDDI